MAGQSHVLRGNTNADSFPIDDGKSMFCHMGQLQQMCRTEHGVCSDDLDVLISKVYASC